MTIKACLFDVFGTLTDWRGGIAKTAAPIFQASGVEFDPQIFATRWRAEYQPGMARVRDGNRPHTKLDILHRENLDHVLDALDLSLPEEARDALNAGWANLPTWPDVPAALDTLRETHLVAPCSNGSIPIMMGIARRNGLHWDCIAGAPLARDYKPKRGVYLESAAAFGLHPSEVMMIAAHNDDLAAARAAGLATGFFPRPTEYGPDQKTDLEAAADWDIVADDLPALVLKLAN